MYRKILIGGATAAVILGSGTAALALSGSATVSGTPTPSSTSSSAASGSHAGKKGHKGALLRRAAHGEIVLHTKKGFVTVQFVKGTVTSVSASSITVQSADKKSETFVVNKDTVVKSRTKAAKGATPTKPTDSSISKVSKGDHVGVFGRGASKPTANRIVDVVAK